MCKITKWANDISQDLSVRCVSDIYFKLQQTPWVVIWSKDTMVTDNIPGGNMSSWNIRYQREYVHWIKNCISWKTCRRKSCNAFVEKHIDIEITMRRSAHTYASAVYPIKYSWFGCTVEPANIDHLYNAFDCCFSFSEVIDADWGKVFPHSVTLSVFWGASRWPWATWMSPRRQRSIV